MHGTFVKNAINTGKSKTSTTEKIVLRNVEENPNSSMRIIARKSPFLYRKY